MWISFSQKKTIYFRCHSVKFDIGWVKEAINSKEPLKIPKEFWKLDIEAVNLVNTFIRTTQDEIKTYTFKPLKYTDPKESRMSFLLPLYDFKHKTIQLDSQKFWEFINNSSKKDPQLKDLIPNEKTDSSSSSMHWEVFNFQKIGIRKEKDLCTDKRCFW